VRLNHYRRGHGEPLILIHGIGSRWQMWEPVIDSLASERDVIAIDLPGFGASPMPPEGTPAGVESLVSLVLEFLGEIGIERPHSAGNSLGGLIVLEMAKRGLVRSATALSPAGFANWPENALTHALFHVSRPVARALAPHADGLLVPRAGRRIALCLFVGRPTQLSPAEAALNLRGLAYAPWFDATLPEIQARAFADGDRIEVPVTIAWGTRDLILIPRQARRAAAAIPGARLVMLEGCGHVPTFDDPEWVTRILVEGSS
jgi:pimeloyl-ACP methyl ester carboxylesterase